RFCCSNLCTRDITSRFPRRISINTQVSRTATSYRAMPYYVFSLLMENQRLILYHPENVHFPASFLHLQSSSPALILLLHEQLLPLFSHKTSLATECYAFHHPVLKFVDTS